MTKLEIIQRRLNELAASGKIVIEDTEEKNFLPYADGYWSHTVEFCIRLLTDETTAEQLQKAMMNLIPELPPTTVDRFHDWSDGTLHGGLLYFDEDIGTSRTQITLTDGHLFNTKGFKGDTCIIENKIQRRIWVRVLPKIEPQQKRKSLTHWLFH